MVTLVLSGHSCTVWIILTRTLTFVYVGLKMNFGESQNENIILYIGSCMVVRSVVD